MQLIVVTFSLYQSIGPSAFMVCGRLFSFFLLTLIVEGALLLCGAVPLQTWLGNQFGRLRVKTARKTDFRIRLMNEIVNGMKVIKMFTWEKPFAILFQIGSFVAFLS